MKLELKHLIEAVVAQQSELVFGGLQKQNNQLNTSDTIKTQGQIGTAPASGAMPSTPSTQTTPASQVSATRPFPLPWQPGGSADSAEGEYVPTPGGEKPVDTTPVTPPPKPQPKPQPQVKPQPQTQTKPQVQPQGQPKLTPSERYRQSQDAYAAARRAHGEAMNVSNRGAWTIGENTVTIQFKPGHLKGLLNDAFDPNNPFPMPWDRKPSPKPITPSGPYTPTPGGVRPTKPTVVAPKSGKIATGSGMGGAGTETEKEKGPNWGYLAVIPPEKVFSSITGRIGDASAWNTKSERQYERHYDNLLKAAGGVAAGIAALPGIRNLIGGGMGIAGRMIPKIPKSVSAVVGGAVPLLKSYEEAAREEGKMMFKKAFLDPRAGSKI